MKKVGLVEILSLDSVWIDTIVILDDQFLSYFAVNSEGDKGELINKISIVNLFLSSLQEEAIGKENSFVLFGEDFSPLREPCNELHESCEVEHPDSKTFFCACHTEEERLDWIKVLETVLDKDNMTENVSHSNEEFQLGSNPKLSSSGQEWESFLKGSTSEDNLSDSSDLMRTKSYNSLSLFNVDPADIESAKSLLDSEQLEETNVSISEVIKKPSNVVDFPKTDIVDEVVDSVSSLSDIQRRLQEEKRKFMDKSGLIVQDTTDKEDLRKRLAERLIASSVTQTESLSDALFGKTKESEDCVDGNNNESEFVIHEALIKQRKMEEANILNIMRERRKLELQRLEIERKQQDLQLAVILKQKEEQHKFLNLLLDLKITEENNLKIERENQEKQRLLREQQLQEDEKMITERLVEEEELFKLLRDRQELESTRLSFSRLELDESLRSSGERKLVRVSNDNEVTPSMLSRELDRSVDTGDSPAYRANLLHENSTSNSLASSPNRKRVNPLTVSGFKNVENSFLGVDTVVATVSADQVILSTRPLEQEAMNHLQHNGSKDFSERESLDIVVQEDVSPEVVFKKEWSLDFVGDSLGNTVQYGDDLAYKAYLAKHKLLKIGVRVRPFSKVELHNNSRRIVSLTNSQDQQNSESKNGGEDIRPVITLMNPLMPINNNLDAIAEVANYANLSTWAKTFCHFDYCFWSCNNDSKYANRPLPLGFATQGDIYENMGKDIVFHALNGLSSTVFAYGESGSGKSHTLFGGISNSQNELQRSFGSSFGSHSVHTLMEDSVGLVQRVLIDLFAGLNKSCVDTKVRLSFYEIYNEKIRDLLWNPTEAELNASFDTQYSSNNAKNAGFPELRVREHPIVGPYIEHIRKAEAKTVEEALRLVYDGLRKRRRLSTNSNCYFDCSRTHAVLSIELTPILQEDILESYSANVIPLGGTNATKVFKHVKVQIVDLAGSDAEFRDDDIIRILQDKRSQKRLSGPKNDLKVIRQTLSSLGHVIRSLKELNKDILGMTKSVHDSVNSSIFERSRSTKDGDTLRKLKLPYRDSLLTWILKDGLANFRYDSQTIVPGSYVALIATVSPAHASYSETYNTLKFAERLCLPVQTSDMSHVLDSSNFVEELEEDCADASNQLPSDLNEKLTSNINANLLLKETVIDPQQRLARLANETPVSHEKAVSPVPVRTPLDFIAPKSAIAEKPIVNVTGTPPLFSMTKVNHGVANKSQIDVEKDKPVFSIADAAQGEKGVSLRPLALPVTAPRRIISKDPIASSAISVIEKPNLTIDLSSINHSVASPVRVASPVITKLTSPERKSLVNISTNSLGHEKSPDERRLEFLDIPLNPKNFSDELYKDMQNRIVELQMELRNCTTDRDSLKLELLLQKERVIEIQGKLKNENESQVLSPQPIWHYGESKLAKEVQFQGNVSIAELEGHIINANKTISYLKSLVERKDEDIGKLMEDMKEERRCRIDAEKSLEIQMIEFLERLDSMKRLSDESASELRNIHSGQEEILQDRCRNLMKEVETQREVIIALKLNSKLNDRVSTVNDESVMVDQMKDEYNKISAECARLSLQRKRCAKCGFVPEPASVVSDQMLDSELPVSVVEMKRQLVLEHQQEKYKLVEQINHFRKLIAESDASLRYWRQLAQSSSAELSQLKRNADKKQAEDKFEEFIVGEGDDKTISVLKRTNSALQKENSSLSKQLSASLDECDRLRENLSNTTQDMQQEFASLWLTVQQLTKADEDREHALKKALQEKSMLEHEVKRLKSDLFTISDERDRLNIELSEIDFDLMRVAQDYGMSPGLGMGLSSSSNKWRSQQKSSKTWKDVQSQPGLESRFSGNKRKEVVSPSHRGSRSTSPAAIRQKQTPVQSTSRVTAASTVRGSPAVQQVLENNRVANRYTPKPELSARKRAIDILRGDLPIRNFNSSESPNPMKSEPVSNRKPAEIYEGNIFYAEDLNDLLNKTIAHEEGDINDIMDGGVVILDSSDHSHGPVQTLESGGFGGKYRKQGTSANGINSTFGAILADNF